MQSFEDWLASCTVPQAKTYTDTLLSLGLSHHTFRRPTEDVVQDLIAAGLPRLAAADIVSAAKTFFDGQKERSQLPLAVFWDVENVRIPGELSGEDVARCIKTKMKPFGHLAVFNAYFEVSSQHMPADKRSALQLSGCHIIDTPHINRKEVADKMIIVDALLFALENKDKGGTLCFITGDTDYAYMLSRLSELKQFRTVLVTQSKSRDVLYMSAHSVFNWGLDILGGSNAVPASPVAFLNRWTRQADLSDEDESRSETRTPSTAKPHNRHRTPQQHSATFDPSRLPPGFPIDALPGDNRSGSAGSGGGDTTSLGLGGTGSNQSSLNATLKDVGVASVAFQAPPGSVPKDGKNGSGSTKTPITIPSPKSRFPRIESIADMLPSAEEEEEDAMTLVKQVMLELQTGMNYRPLKSLVGIKMKEKNPIRFGDRTVRAKALEKAADPATGFLKQEGEGGNVTLAFRTEAFRPPHA